MDHLMKHLLVIVCLSFLVGCGGSGSESSDDFTGSHTDNGDISSGSISGVNNEEDTGNISISPIASAVDTDKKYSDLGRYHDSVRFYKNDHDKYVVYYPEGYLDAAPIVLFLPGGHVDISQYSGLMEFIASHGYFVIGTNVSNEYSAYSTNDSFDKALAVAQQSHPELDFYKMAVIGHSQGGGLAFPVMKHYLHQKQYGSDASVVISLDGWFPFGMNQQNLRSLVTNASFIQFGGVKGTGTDPRINLSIINLMPTTNEKSYVLLGENTGHMYAAGSLNSVLVRKDLLKPLMAVLAHSFKQDTNVDTLLFTSYDSTIERIKKALKDIDSYSGGDCKGKGYNAISVIKDYDIDYCQPGQY